METTTVPDSLQSQIPADALHFHLDQRYLSRYWPDGLPLRGDPRPVRILQQRFRTVATARIGRQAFLSPSWGGSFPQSDGTIRFGLKFQLQRQQVQWM